MRINCNDICNVNEVTFIYIFVKYAEITLVNSIPYKLLRNRNILSGHPTLAYIIYASFVTNRRHVCIMDGIFCTETMVFSTIKKKLLTCTFKCERERVRVCGWRWSGCMCMCACECVSM